MGPGKILDFFDDDDGGMLMMVLMLMVILGCLRPFIYTASADPPRPFRDLDVQSCMLYMYGLCFLLTPKRKLHTNGTVHISINFVSEIYIGSW